LQFPAPWAQHGVTAGWLGCLADSRWVVPLAHGGGLQFIAQLQRGVCHFARWCPR
jgi:hypothetical protein